MALKAIRAALKAHADPDIARHSQRYFKTGPGEYGAGDVFLGIRVPQLRRLARAFADAPLTDVEQLLHSRYHEARLLALLLMVRRFQRGDEAEQARIYRLYRANLQRVNNWDLVDASAPYIVGAYLADRNKAPLHRWARSRNLWLRRIAMLATFFGIKHGRYHDALQIAHTLVGDPEDLIHKAVGWMLREIGKRDIKSAEPFVAAHCKTMPRTMLRYAIERYPESKRRRYLNARS